QKSAGYRHPALFIFNTLDFVVIDFLVALLLGLGLAQAVVFGVALVVPVVLALLEAVLVVDHYLLAVLLVLNFLVDSLVVDLVPGPVVRFLIYLLRFPRLFYLPVRRH